MKVTQNMSVLLWLRKPKKNENATIMVRVTIVGKRADWSLGKKVNPDHWISGAGVLKSSAKESKIVNPYLNQVRGEIQSHFNILSTQFENITPEMVRDAFLGIDFQKKAQQQNIFITKAQTVLVRKRFSTNDELKSAVYASLVNYLIEKEIIRTGPFDASIHKTATLQDIDENKVREFV